MAGRPRFGRVTNSTTFAISSRPATTYAGISRGFGRYVMLARCTNRPASRAAAGTALTACPGDSASVRMVSPRIG